MTIYLVKMFGGSLALTLITEVLVLSLFWGLAFRRKVPESTSAENTLTEPGPRWSNLLLLVILVNVLTNPPAVLLCWLGRLFLPLSFRIPVQLAIEAAVVFTEVSVYHSFAGKRQWRVEKPVALAVTANLCSWLLGVILSGGRTMCL